MINYLAYREPLLGNDCETMVDARQQILNKQQLNYKRGTMFSTWSELGCYKQDNWSNESLTALARASSIYKIQTHPLVREGASQNQDRNSRGTINIWSWAPRRVLDTKTY
jgi:hypothetical protein